MRMFLHRLALALHRTVAEIERDVSYRELLAWRRFDVIHPLPDRLADIHHARLCHLVVNLAGTADHTIEPRDFLVLKDDALYGQPVGDGRTEAERLEAEWRGG